MKVLKKIFSLSLVLMITLVCVTGCGKKDNNVEDDAEESYNTNQGVVNDKEVGGLKLTNTSLVSDEYSAQLTTLVSNTTENSIEAGEFKIHVKDKSGNEIVTTNAYIGGYVPANDSRIITTTFDRNLDDAYTIEYEIIN